MTANKTYTAAWNANQYIINYNGAGGTLSKTSDKVTYGGNIPSMPSASRAGYTFTGWTWSGYSGSGAYTYVGNSTATANWKANQYKINYDANGGQVSPASNGVTYGQPCPTAPTPTRTGYTFYNCKKLSKVNGGKGLVNIGAKAFMNCRKLKKFTLYTSVMTVGKKAFYGCKKLKKVRSC